MSLRQYITEAEIRQHIPEAGDQFDIELEDGTLLETYIIGVRNSAILLDATPEIIGVLREWADLDGEAGEVLFEGQFKQSMHVAAESMSLEDFVQRYGHLFSPGEAEQFWHSINDTVKENAWAGVNPRVDQPLIKGTDQRAKSGYYPEPKSPVKKLDAPTNKFDKITKENDYDTEVDRGEYDYEGDMAKDDLQTIIRAARRLTGMLDDNENMPEWVQSKINKAADYVDTAADYIESNQDELGVAEAGPVTIGSKLPKSDTATFGLEPGRGYSINQPRDFKPGDRPRAIQQLIPTQDKKDHIRSRLGKHVAPVLPEQGIAEGSMSDLRRAVYQIILDIHFGAKYGDEMIDTVTDELGDYFDDVEASDDAVLKKVYAYVRQEGAEAEGDPARMDRVALNAIEFLNYEGARGNLNEFAPGMAEAKYQGREVSLGKPTRGDVKKFKVYVRDPSTGNIKKVNFGHGGTSAKRAGQKTMKIKKSDPARRRSFRARHNCDNPGPRTKARYWSCRAW